MNVLKFEFPRHQFNGHLFFRFIINISILIYGLDLVDVLLLLLLEGLFCRVRCYISLQLVLKGCGIKINSRIS